MALSIFQIKRWTKMLLGKSVEHVHQNRGVAYSTKEIRGYYNDFREKITLGDLSILNTEKMPVLNLADGGTTVFPVAVFQYALGCYDLFLTQKKDIYLNKFLQCAEWTLRKMDTKGRWDNFSFVYPNYPYGAMAQGEGASVLVRAYTVTHNDAYLKAAKKAIDFMLLDISDGGTSLVSEEKLILCEYTIPAVVLNGWIFAWWGLYDYVLATNDRDTYRNAMDKSLKTMIDMLPQFDCAYWSMYDLEGKITSPFYHNLHIAQMQAMYELTEQPIFDLYAIKWEKEQKNLLCKTKAFVKKAWQKIKE